MLSIQVIAITEYIKKGKIMTGVNTDKLRKLVDNYVFHSKPSNGNQSDPCTIRDLNNVVRNTASVLMHFIEELEK